MRLSVLPIGAYEPRWFMGPVHMDPAEAVLAHQRLALAVQSLGMHYGTFQLTDEAVEAPLEELAGGARRRLGHGAPRTSGHRSHFGDRLLGLSVFNERQKSRLFRRRGGSEEFALPERSQLVPLGNVLEGTVAVDADVAREAQERARR